MSTFDIAQRIGDSQSHVDIDQSLNCIFTQLPVEILLYILHYLDTQFKLVLRQTSRIFRSLPHNQQLRLNRNEQLDYLFILARDIPDKWVCHRCVRLHKVIETDTPYNSHDAFCPGGWRLLLMESPKNVFGLDFNHRHHQLTLKYNRMNNLNKKHDYQEYLQKLLAPHHACFRPLPFIVNAKQSVVAGQYWTYPKIVNGRYLLFSTWRYDQDTEEVSHNTIGFMKMCQHQNTYTSTPGTPPQVIRDRTGVRLLQPMKLLSSLLFHAFKAPNVTIYGFCPYCSTDFSIVVSSKRAIIQAWQDFGPEGSPHDLSWRIHCRGASTLSVKHEPGSIYDLYRNINFK